MGVDTDMHLPHIAAMPCPYCPHCRAEAPRTKFDLEADQQAAVLAVLRARQAKVPKEVLPLGHSSIHRLIIPRLEAVGVHLSVRRVLAILVALVKAGELVAVPEARKGYSPKYRVKLP